MIPGIRCVTVSGQGSKSTQGYVTALATIRDFWFSILGQMCLQSVSPDDEMGEHVFHFLLVKGGPIGMNALTLAGCVSTSVSSFLWASEKPGATSLTEIKPKRK